MGCCCAIVLSNVGAAYGMAKSSIGISAVSVMQPQNMIRSTLSILLPSSLSLSLSLSSLHPTHPPRSPTTDLLPIILSSVLSIFGLITSILIASALVAPSALHTNFLHLAAGLSVGLSCLASGFSIGVIGDAGVRGAAMQPKMFVGMALVLIFAEVLGEFFFTIFVSVFVLFGFWGFLVERP
ncbi:putative vacuolar atp synthase 16 kda proteolipid subunit protein [Botrytis fragariae]|uniref:Putative vacuolar atp synthase 16 kDa proteolipid subunit protein n=1 Tax=Botrytis fragariae TaxID=1964551 RepID=A0A8H6B5C5_9HELO|nr:putative vacuolar atp synthase 16 kda proteolipid subunit protein [Botrytis fragariae]KAF5879282.1 putative vacuolar atp synthase 16 kda proteolipid subunit protein [Botrytis fragariae]